MKKSMLVLTTALLFGGLAAAQTAAPASAAQVPALTDVPAGHWAKDAIDRLISKGVILGYPDGTFRGTQNLTRYEAAVIIARLLDQVNTGAVRAPTGEDATALQNAVQELAADLAALGVRVSDLEENAVSKDDFARLEARVEQLSTASGDAAAVAKIQSQIDDLSARAADYDSLRADVDDNASSIAALNDLTVLLNQDILDLQDRVSAVETAQTDFVHRSDFDNLSGKVSGIDTRVKTLENAPKFSVTGSFEPKYGTVNLTSGSTAGGFDIDRLTNNTFISGYFSNDDYCPKMIDPTTPNKYGSTVTKRGSGGVRCVDTNNKLSDFGATVTVGVTNTKLGNGAINIDSAHAGFTVHNGATPADGTFASETYAAMSHADVNGSLDNGVKFSVRFDNGNDSNSNFKFNDYLLANDNDVNSAVYRRGVISTVDASALSPLAPKIMIVSGAAYPQAFTEDGVTNNYLTGVVPGGSGPLTPMLGGYFGVRASINPYNLGTVAVSYAQGNTNSFVGSPLRRDAVSADADLKFGPVALSGAFVSSYKTQLVADANLDNADKAGFIKFGVDYMGLTLNANYRYIDPAYEDGYAGMSSNDAGFYSGVGGYQSSAPFGPNENGFGMDASYGFGPIKVGGYVNSFKAAKDNYGPTYGLGARHQTAYGVNLGTTAMRGLSLTGFFNNAELDGNKISELYGNDTNENNYDQFDFTDPLLKYSSNFGASIAHNGKAADALVKNLNINATYARFYDDSARIKDYKYDDFRAWATYTGKFGPVNVTPYGRFHYFNNPEAGQLVTGDKYTSSIRGYEYGAADTEDVTEINSYTTVKGGIQISTDPLEAVTKPSIFGGISARSTKFDKSNQDATTETFANVGVALNEFLLPGNKLSVGYSYYQGYNLGDSSYGAGVGVGNNAFSATSDRLYRGPQSGGSAPWVASQGNTNVKLSGVYGQLEAFGLKAAYGVFDFTNLNTNAKSTAEAFKVSSKIIF